jgi:hypothetical protein
MRRRANEDWEEAQAAFVNNSMTMRTAPNSVGSLTRRPPRVMTRDYKTVSLGI